MDEDGADRRILHLEGGCLPVLHLEIVGRIVHVEAFRALGFHGIVRSILQGQEHPAVSVCCHGTHQGVVHTADFKCSVGNPLLGVIRVDLDQLQAAHRVVIHRDGLGVVGVDDHRLGTGLLMDGVALDGLGFRDDECPHQTVNDDLAVFVSAVEAHAGGHAAVVVHHRAVRLGDGKLYPLQGLMGDGIQLVDDKAALGGVGDDHRLGIYTLPDDYIGGGGVHDVPMGRLDLREHVCAGGQVGDADLTAAVGGENTVLGEGGIANYPVQSHLAAGGRRHSELGPGERLARGAVPFLDDQLTLGLVLKGEGYGTSLFDLDGLALGINHIPRRRGDLGHDHALAGFQALDADFAVFIGAEDAVGITNEGAVRIGDLELCVGQGLAGIGGADLADEQIPVRHVFKADSDDTLLPAVRKIDGLGGLDDAVPVRRIHLLHDVRSWLQARPDGHAVGAGHLLSNHGAAGTGGASQVAELEGGPAQGLASDAVRLVYHDGVEGDVLKCQRLVSAALNIDLLGGRLLDGEAGGGFQLRHPVPAVPQALQHDLAAGVSEVDPQVVELAGVGAIAAVPELEFGPPDGAAGDAVYLLDGKGGLFVVLEIDGVVPVGIEGDQLGLRIHEIRGGNRFF